jgi:hypothetical protein
MADKLIKEAKKTLRTMTERKRERAFNRALRDREFIIQKAKSDGDLKLALDAIKDRDKIHGLYIEQVEHSGRIELKNIDLSRLTDEQLSILEGLIKKEEDPKPFLLSIGIHVG